MITQGANLPILIRDIPRSMQNPQSISITIFVNGMLQKRWSKSDLIFDEDMIYAPLTQEDTMGIRSGMATIEIEYCDQNGTVRPRKTINTAIRKRMDSTILDGAGMQTFLVVDYDGVPEADTGKIVFKGYSPYVGENGNWYEYDSEQDKFIDTGVHAEGKPYDHSEEFSRLANQVRSDASETSKNKDTAEDAAKRAESAEAKATQSETKALNSARDAYNLASAAGNAKDAAVVAKNTAETYSEDAKKSANDARSTFNMLDPAVTKAISDFNTNATNKTNAFNTNAGAKQNAFDQNAIQKKEDFDEHAGEISFCISRLSESIDDVQNGAHGTNFERDKGIRTNGVISHDPLYILSKKIPVEPNTSVTYISHFMSNSYCIVEFDESGTLVDYWTVRSGDERTFTTSATTSYLIATFLTDYKPNDGIVVNGRYIYQPKDKNIWGTAENRASIEELYESITNIGEDVGSAKEDLQLLSSDDGIKPNMIDSSFSGSFIVNIQPVYSREDYYWYISSNKTASGQARANNFIAVIDVDDIDDTIKFSTAYVDTTDTEPVFAIATSTDFGGTINNYFQKQYVNGGASSANLNAIVDEINVPNRYIILNKAKLLAKYPTAKALWFNVDKNNYYFIKEGSASKKALNWALLPIGNIVGNLLVVGDINDDTVDYHTINDALAQAKNGDTIFIKDGEYKETVIVNKYVHLVGQSKLGTILYQDIGDYDNCPLLITQGSVSNMTIKSLAPTDTSGLSTYAYAIHLDKQFASESKYRKCEIYNCNIYSEVNDAVGAGTNYDSEYDVHDCYITVRANPIKSGACAFKIHNGQYQTGGYVRLMNNVIIAESADGGGTHDLLFHNGGITNTTPIDTVMVGNVVRYYTNTCPTIFVKSPYCFGNKSTNMNA